MNVNQSHQTPMTDDEMRAQLSRLPAYSTAVQLAQRLLLRLKEEEPWDRKIEAECHKALFNLLLEDPRNIETFVFELHDGIRYYDHKRKGKKLVSVKAMFVKRKTTTEKV